MATKTLKEILEEKKQQRAAAQASAIRTLKPASGKHIYRILPGAKESNREQFWQDFGMHFVKAQANSNKVESAYLCLEKTYGRACPVCAAISDGLSRANDDETIATLNEAKATQKYLINVLHLTGDKPDEPQVLEVGSRVFDGILEIASEYLDSSEKAIFDLEDGLDIVISKEGSGMNTKYLTMPSMKKSAPVDKSILSKMIDLETYAAQENETRLTKTLTKLGEVVGVLPPAAGAQAALPQGTGRGGRVSLEDLSEEADDAIIDDGPSVDELDDLLADLDDVGS